MAGKKDQDKAAADKAAAEVAAKEAADKAAADAAAKEAADKAAAEAAAKEAAGKATANSRQGQSRRADKSERRWFKVSGFVLHDGQEVKAGEEAAVTRADFDQLKSAGVVSAEWDDAEVAKS